MRMKLGTAASLAASLGGCATSLNVVSDPFVAPAKFQFLRCEDIAKRLVATQTREHELRGLMDRASTDTGGAPAKMLRYQPDYHTRQTQIRRLHQAPGAKQNPEEAPQTGHPPHNRPKGGG